MRKRLPMSTKTGRAITLSLLMILAGRTASAREPISLTITTDQPEYVSGETISVSVSATYSDGSPVVSVKNSQIVIMDGENRRVVRDKLVDSGTGTLIYGFVIPGSPRVGTWKIKVKVEDTSHSRSQAEITVLVGDGLPPCLDADGDGFPDAACGGDDCNDGDPTVFPGATEICDDGIDNDCDGAVDEECEPECPDADGDGFTDTGCGGDDCNDDDPTIYPGATEICGDGIDQNCDGVDLQCGTTHETLTWDGQGTCLQCHTDQANEMHGSVHYQWKGETPEMTNGSGQQGKIAGGVNSYCISILGNWNVCGSCHIGRGALPAESATVEQLENIDCMMCHQKKYKRTRVDGVFVPDVAAMAITMDDAVKTVHLPERLNCLQCHAKAGGGDAVKRGDLALAQIDTADHEFDVHMATTGANLACQDCHTFTDHRVAGRGSDLRPTDSDVVLDCSNCHTSMAQTGGHPDEYVDRHTARVACQTCHVPIYAKDAVDTAATEATETHRTWLDSHSTAPPFHPASMKANDLVPVYRHWNRLSNNYLLHDEAVIDPATGRYPTSRPEGGIDHPDSKLYPFKYKTAEQPIMNSTGKLIALDTSVFFATGDAAAATEQGLVNMGHSATESYSWVETDTFQLLNHEVSPSSQALGCNECHGSTDRINLQGELGYELKGPQSQVCYQCHGNKGSKSFVELHNKHVKDKGYDCSWCHQFSRPEQNLRMP